MVRPNGRISTEFGAALFHQTFLSYTLKVLDKKHAFFAQDLDAHI